MESNVIFCMIEQATIGCLELAAALGAEDPPEAKDTVAKRMWIQSRPGQAPNPFTKTYNQVRALTIFFVTVYSLGPNF